MARNHGRENQKGVSEMKIKFPPEAVVGILAAIGVIMVFYYISLFPICSIESDPKARASAFEACMKLLPQGPTTTTYNDWDDVVYECGRQASINTERKICK